MTDQPRPGFTFISAHAMNLLRENNSPEAFIPPASIGEPPVTDATPGCPAATALPEGWRRLATGLRGVRLFRVAAPVGGVVHWAVEITLNGQLVRRRFAGELHARAWLTIAAEPHPRATNFDLEELNGPLRAAGVAAHRRAG